jgi:hypothetical protein
MIQGERIVSYDVFMEIMAEACRLSLCSAPGPHNITGLMPGTAVVLVLERGKWGCRGGDGSIPLHHHAYAYLPFYRVAHPVDIVDDRWAELPTADEYFAALPEVTVPTAVLYVEAAEDARRARLSAAAVRVTEISKGLDERLASHDTAEEPPSEEDGGSGVREPRPAPGPTSDTGAAIPSEVAVG